MKRFISWSRPTIAIAIALLAPAAALADDPAPPTAAQIDQAKKAFAEGKKLHEAGKTTEAIEKFKESYRLSRNPLLLYNIGFTLDEAKQEDMALFYYRKFLKDAPADAAQRAIVSERVKVLEKQSAAGAGTTTEPVTTPATTTEPTEATPPTPAPTKKPDKAIKPAGTYSATDFQHQVVETAPPSKALDVTAFVPEDSGFVVTLYFRTAGEGKFTAKEMRWRYKELVGRIPPPKMIGNAVQYYVEVKDQAGTVVTRNGKATSPNLINLEAGAPAKFYPDFTDEAEPKPVASGGETKPNGGDVEDPLSKTKQVAEPDAPGRGDPQSPDQPSATGTGFRDVGSTKFKYTKWGTTIGAGAMLALGVVSYIQAGKYARALEDDSTSCGLPPCLEFDSYGADVQSTGQRYQLLTNISLVVGISTAAVAGYFWYRQMTAGKRGEQRVSKRTSDDGTASWLIAPAFGDDFAGAAAAARF